MSLATDWIDASKPSNAQSALSGVASFWFVTVCIGQGLFVYHIVSFYGGTMISGDLQKWNDQLYHGIITGDAMGNVALGAHLTLAAIITIGGPLQLLPYMQRNAKAFHRMNGKVYLITAVVMSISGLYMILMRGVIGGAVMATGNTINATLILISALATWRFAMKRRLEAHRKWALRLFILVSGVWFFRIGFGLWIFINQGAPGHNDTFNGPFDIFLAFGHTLIPLLLLEGYFRMQSSRAEVPKWLATAILFGLTIAMGLGIFMATVIFWLPE